jgi:phosphate starvation-inducible protein PhoH and related proteins
MSRRQKDRRAAQRQAGNRNQERIVVRPKSLNQQNYIISMVENDITFCTGPAGSGKSSVAVGLACNWLQENKISRIIITRPTIEAGKGLGHLPGDKDEKLLPYVMPVLEEMHKYIGREMVRKLKDAGIIEICPLEYMRGRNFHNCFMILDEAQNATYEQIKMFMTRIGIDSRAVINGDADQTDLPERFRGGMINIMSKVDGLQGVGVCQLEASDIVRNPIIGRILERLK